MRRAKANDEPIQDSNGNSAIQYLICCPRITRPKAKLAWVKRLELAQSACKASALFFIFDKVFAKELEREGLI